MLEFIFSFIKSNIVLIFLVIESLAIASVYSRGVKFFFLSILGLAAIYIGLLCLYQKGYGIESLYIWSSKYVIFLCSQIDYFSVLWMNHSFLFVRIIEGVFKYLTSESILCLPFVLLFILILVLTIRITLPRVKSTAYKKIEIKEVRLNKFSNFYNTINKKQSKFILNSVFRC